MKQAVRWSGAKREQKERHGIRVQSRKNIKKRETASTGAAEQEKEEEEKYV